MLQVLCDRRKLFQRCFEFLSNLESEHVRIGKVRAVFERFVPKPEDVEIDLVTFEQVVVGEALERLAFGAFMAVLGVEALDELVEIRTFQRSFFQSEVLIRAQVVDPELFRPRLFACWFAVEEQDVRLYTLRVKDAGWQTE